MALTDVALRALKPREIRYYVSDSRGLWLGETLCGRSGLFFTQAFSYLGGDKIDGNPIRRRVMRPNRHDAE